MAIMDRFQHAWNAFFSRDPTTDYEYGISTHSYRPDRVRFSRGNEKSIVTSVYNRIAMDAAAIDVKHIRLDDNDRYKETIDSPLNNCLELEANIDQTGRAFFQDVYMSMLDEGCVALVPIDTDVDPRFTDSYKIYTIRTGKILEWRPDKVKVRVYNERLGRRDDIWMPKRIVGIVENPLYAVINEKNSTMQRLIRKLNLLDAIDEQSGSGKLDLIIQLPYSIKSDARRKQAEKRTQDIENQLTGSKFGIAYADSTERITQLNRPIENNLMKQIEYLTSMLYSQLGITQQILDGSANEETMINYYTRTIEPIVAAVVDEMKRKFLSKTARSQKQSIAYFRDLFSLVPVTKLAEIANTLTSSEVISSNEVRQILGLKPSSDPRADQLVNSNINPTGDTSVQEPEAVEEYYEEGESQNGEL